MGVCFVSICSHNRWFFSTWSIALSPPKIILRFVNLGQRWGCFKINTNRESPCSSKEAVCLAARKPDRNWWLATSSVRVIRHTTKCFAPSPFFFRNASPKKSQTSPLQLNSENEREGGRPSFFRLPAGGSLANPRQLLQVENMWQKWETFL